MCSEQLECFRIGSSIMSFGSWNPNFRQDRPILGKITFSKNYHFFLETPNGSLWKQISIYFKKNFRKLVRQVKYKNYKLFSEKGLYLDYHMAKFIFILLLIIWSYQNIDHTKVDTIQFKLGYLYWSLMSICVDWIINEIRHLLGIKLL